MEIKSMFFFAGKNHIWAIVESLFVNNVLCLSIEADLVYIRWHRQYIKKLQTFFSLCNHFGCECTKKEFQIVFLSRVRCFGCYDACVPIILYNNSVFATDLNVCCHKLNRQKYIKLYILNEC